MHAAWYDRQGPAGEVLQFGHLPVPLPGPGEVRIRLQVSGVNPGDVRKRRDDFGCGMPFPRVVPHSDGAGVIDRLGAGVDSARLGQRVWCHGAQRGRPAGTAAEYTVVPSRQAVPLPAGVPMALAACLGIPGLTAHRAVHVAGSVAGRTVLVHGVAGAVGALAAGLARQAGAQVIGTVRRTASMATAELAGAHHTLCTQGLSEADTVAALRQAAPQGVDHVIEVDFAAHLAMNQAVLRMGGRIACYATGQPRAELDLWPLVFQNLSLHFLGSDDFTDDHRSDAAQALNSLLGSGWQGIRLAHRFPLDQVVQAHQAVEQPDRDGRVLLDIHPPTDP